MSHRYALNFVIKNASVKKTPNVFSINLPNIDVRQSANANTYCVFINILK